jgi:hypothetical protein
MAGTRSRRVQLGVQNIDVRGHVLERLAADFGKLTVARFDEHIKNKCDLHGKGSHIKGAGPNYLKSRAVLSFDDLTDPAVDRFIDTIATRVAQKIRRG